MPRFQHCDQTCTTDCGHCKGAGHPAVKIVQVRWVPDWGSDDPGPQMADYDGADENVIPCDDTDEAIEALKRHGVDFASTGSDWAADPDGSFVSNYGTGEQVAVTGHLVGAWTPQEITSIQERVG